MCEAVLLRKLSALSAVHSSYSLQRKQAHCMKIVMVQQFPCWCL